MTRTETIKLFNGMLNGTRKVSEIFADWPTKTYKRYMAYPEYYENTLGIPVSPLYVQHKRRTYPKVRIMIMTDSVNSVQKRLQKHVADGNEIYVPMIVDDYDVEEEQADEEVEPQETAIWASKKTWIANKPDEYIDDDGTRMVRIGEKKDEGTNVYIGFSEIHLRDHPNAYDEVLQPLILEPPVNIERLEPGIIPDKSADEAATAINSIEPKPKYCMISVKNTPTMTHGALGKFMRR